MPPITLIHLASQVTDIPVIIIDSQGLTPVLHRENILNLIGSEHNTTIVGLSFMSEEANEAYEFTTYLKNKGVKTVIHGGVHPTLFPQISIDSGANYIITGEGDYTLNKLLKQQLTGINIDSILTESAIPDLSFVKPLDWSYVSLSDYSSNFVNDVQVPIISARGCFGKCTFCFSSHVGNGVRKYSSNYLFKSIQNAYKHGYRHFMFYDDDLLFDADSLLELSKEMMTIFPDMKWDCMASVRALLKARDQIPALIENGMEGCHLGVESINDDVLYKMRKRHNSEQAKESLRTLLELDLPIKEALIIALFENDTPYYHQIMIDEFLNLGLDPSEARKWLQFATPLPGTSFQKTSKNTGITFSGFDTNYVNYILNSFLDFNLGKIKFVSQSIDFNEHLMRAIRTSGSMRNSMPFESARISSYQLINHIYSRKVMVEQ
ncbi:radical SAM protein [Candidatus Pacearchaeota archaeon]|nr:radical SAM protein [Candidatus Pacearchaeota archaeon]